MGVVDPRLSLAVVAGKVAATTIRRLGRGGGTTLPGRISERIDAGAMRKLVAQLPAGAVVISGTNGKTTTSSLTRVLLEGSGHRVVSNRAGSNLAWGVTAAMVHDSRIGGRPAAEVGVFEVDEGSLPAVVEATTPRIVVVTNLFRDQLDRYGELDSSAAAVSAALASLPSESVAVLCADDPGVAVLGRNLRCRVVYYGLEDQELGDPDLPHAADAKFCPHCGEPLEFNRVYLGHLGHYRCPTGGFVRPEPELRATSLSFKGLDGQVLHVSGLGLDDSRIEVPLSGLYNSYNVLAAIAVARLSGVAADELGPALRGFRAAFGRLERASVAGRTLHLLLAKNPAGFNETLRTSRRLGGGRMFLVAVNDRLADGHDISWIWDTDFELLADSDWVILAGDRALDMAIRLKYAGIAASHWQVVDGSADAIDALLARTKEGDEVFVLPTYTAMLELRAELAGRGYLRQFWDEP
jgi:UDP-N-acetylmuramyl tripeptide synthase